MSTPIDTFEENLRGLLKVAESHRPTAFEARLVESVLAEVASHRRIRTRHLRVGAWLAVTAAAIVLLAVGLRAFHEHPKPSGLTGQPVIASTTRMGQVQEFYGMVSLRNGEPERPAKPAQAIHPGQWIRTRWGSQAEILLDDQSRFLVQPCSLVQIDHKDARRIQLENGAFTAEVAHQPIGKPLTIQTPAGQIQVLGTKLDVHVVTRPNGRKQTRVSVASGRVRMNAAGRDVLLLPNMEGVAEEGRPPVTRCLTSEVNEISRLIRQTQPVAERAGLPAGNPAIIDFNDDVSATVWMVVPVENRGSEPLRQYVLPLKRSGADVQAYTLQGGALPIKSVEQGWQVDLSLSPVEPGSQAQLVVRVPGVKGLFQTAGSGTFRFDRPSGATQSLSLVQVRLPAAANITAVFPKPLETRETPSRLIVTIPAESQQQWFAATDP